MKQINLLFVMSLILAACDRPKASTISNSPTPPSNRVAEAEKLPEPQVFQTSPAIKFNRDKLSALGIKLSDASSAVGTLLHGTASFTLEDLQSLKLHNEQGETVLLSEVAEIEIHFNHEGQAKP